MRSVIKYVGIILVIAGILLVMKNLFTQEDEWSGSKNGNTSKVVYYSAKVQLLDKESGSYLTGASLMLKNSDGQILEKWTTDGGVHLISNLKKGTYTIEQESAPEGYHLNEDGVLFKISNKDQDVTMYNVKMTDEEIEEARRQNTTSNEVGVDNTLSEKSIWAILGGVLCIGLGIGMILFQRRSSSNDV